MSAGKPAPRAHLEDRECFGCGAAFQEWSDRRDPWCGRCRDANHQRAAAGHDRGLDDDADEAQRIREWRTDRI